MADNSDLTTYGHLAVEIYGPSGKPQNGAIYGWQLALDNPEILWPLRSQLPELKIRPLLKMKQLRPGPGSSIMQAIASGARDMTVADDLSITDAANRIRCNQSLRSVFEVEP